MNAILELLNRVLALIDRVHQERQESRDRKEMDSMARDPADYFVKHHSVRSDNPDNPDNASSDAGESERDR